MCAMSPINLIAVYPTEHSCLSQEVSTSVSDIMEQQQLSLGECDARTHPDGGVSDTFSETHSAQLPVVKVGLTYLFGGISVVIIIISRLSHFSGAPNSSPKCPILLHNSYAPHF